MLYKRIKTRFCDNQRSGFFCTVPRSSRITVRMMPVALIFIELHVHNPAYRVVVQQLFDFLYKRGVPKNKTCHEYFVIAFQNIFEYSCFFINGRNRLFEQNMITAFYCRQCRFEMHFILCAYDNRIRKPAFAEENTVIGKHHIRGDFICSLKFRSLFCIRLGNPDNVH